MFEKFLKKHSNWFYFVFRLLVGLLFFQHGAQKLLGWFGKEPVALMSMMGAAGVIEMVGGVLIAIGFFTRLVAGIAAIEMLFAYFMSHHALDALWPIMNRGELALLYFACFLVLLAWGGGESSLEKALLKKETF